MRRNKRVLPIVVAVVVLLAGVGFIPVLQSQRFSDLITDTFLVLGGGAEFRSDVVINDAAYVNVPTAVGTATPALNVNSAGVSNLAEFRKNATPQFTIGNAGVVTGKVVRYATSGTQIICGIQVITDTATITTGLAQSTYCLAQLNATPDGDARTANCTAGTTTVTVKVRNSALTPAANSTGASVSWCAIGTP